MSDPSKSQELQAPDPIATANVPIIAESHDAPQRQDGAEFPEAGISEEKQYERIEAAPGEAFGKGATDGQNHDQAAGQQIHDLTAVKSHATDISSATASTTVPQLVEKPWYRNLNPLRWGTMPPVPKEPIVSREYTAGLLSKMTFSWMTPLMTTGYKRQLEAGDIWAVNPSRAVEPMTLKVKEAFEKRVADGKNNPLFWALHEVFAFEFWLGGCCCLISSLLQALAPFTLRYLIQFATDAYNAHVEGTPAPPIRNGIGLVLGITAMQCIQSLAIGQFIYRGMVVGGQSRAVLISLVYEKAMTISGRAKAGDTRDLALMSELSDQDEKKTKSDDEKKKPSTETKGKKPSSTNDGLGWGNGRIVNLMSVDTWRVDQSSALFHMIWTAPLACIITLVLLLVNLTYSALAGFALLVLGVPLLTKAIQSLFARRKVINSITDQRVSLLQEILQAVRFVKYFGWEMAFLDRLQVFRHREIHAIQVLLGIRNAVNAISLSLPIFASMLSFITYSLTSHNLAPAQVFSSLALFNGLRAPLNLLPQVLGQIIDAWASLKRIEEFFIQEDQEEDMLLDHGKDYAIKLQGASFTWEKTPGKDPDKGTISTSDKKQTGATTSTNPSSSASEKTQNVADDSASASTLVKEHEPFKLHNLNLQVDRNELVAVIGTVGSGKSSLLSALAGNMRKTNGDVIFGASRAFCPQYAWIQNTSLQNNITFGKDMDKDWYEKVVGACALQADIDMLPNGDLTEIGERGITISGGQKQRLNIARAIYFDADIIIMDDPLSAVDAHVGRHIFDNAILGLLKDKCRILATHQLWVLSRCDRVVWVEDGEIHAIDTFENLMRDNVGFQALMETTAVEQHDEPDDEPQDDTPADDEKTAKKAAKKNKKAAALMQQEERAVKSVPWSVYADYVRASGSIWNAPLALITLIASQGANIATSLWLSWWTSDKFNLPTGTYIGVYATLGAVQAMLMFAYSFMLSILGTKASKVMLKQAVTRVLRAPMSFFDTTPLGRITNRFSRDVDVMDNNLGDAMRMFSFTIATCVAVFALIIAYFHFFAVALVPLYFIFILAASYYRASAREVKRYEAVLRSHVFAKFSEGLTGVPSIRAYGLQQQFVDNLRASIDEMNRAYYLTFSNQRWLSIRLDVIGNLLVFTMGILVVTSRFNVSPSIGGLVLSYILSIVQLLQFGVRQLAEVENGMNAVERVRYYGHSLEEEAPLHTIEVRESWPEKGEIEFKKVEMRYRANLPLVLQGLSMHIRGGERIGIVGRTGAGKSSIISTLFRLVEINPGGSIIVDGVDISTIGLYELRSRLAIIPQDPTLFNGTIRSNLDPFSEHSDLELWSALRQADLVSSDGGNTDGAVASGSGRMNLDTIVEEDGLNFSLGQRQLMALARALVRGSQIIVCDEATSSVDMETDDKIQRTMATAFRGKTLVCIAHRLRTIIGYDRICVMDAGRIAELDTPLNLWKQGGIFHGMCTRSNIRYEDIEGAVQNMQRLDAVNV